MSGRMRSVVAAGIVAGVLASVPARAQPGVFPGNLKAGIERLPEGAGKDTVDAPVYAMSLGLSRS